MATLEQIMEGFVPVKDRSWYPWVWPEREWFVKTGRDNKRELQGFIEKVRGIAENDFFFMCDEILRDKNRPPLHIGVHDELCHIMQTEYDVVLLIPRGHLKTTIANVGYSIWRLCKNSNFRLLIASDTEIVAKKFLSETKQNIISNTRLRTVFPDLRPAKENTNHQAYEKWSSQEIIMQRNVISGVPSITAMGTNQTLTGTHYDGAIYDDLVNFDNIKTEEKIEKTKEWYLNSLPLLDPGARKVIIGTRYDDKDLYGFLERKGEMPVYVRAAVENDEYIWPLPQVIKHVQEMKKQLSPYIFSCQYHNDPINEETQDFKSEWIQWWDVKMVRQMMSGEDGESNDENILKKWYGTLAKYMVCDPNRTVKKRSDYTAITVVGVDKDNRRFVLEYLRKKLRAPEIITSFCDMYEKWNPIMAKIEVVGGDEHLQPLIKKELQKRNLTTVKFRGLITQRNISKEDRIRNLQPTFENMLWYLKDGMNELEMELLRFPHAVHDDLVETLAYAETQCIKDMKRKEVKPKDVYKGYKNRVTRRWANQNWRTA